MAIRLSELSYIANAVSSGQQAELLDEAYYGRKSVGKIQKAMDRVYDVYKHNPNVSMMNYKRNDVFLKANADLERAIVDTFGFKRCSVYWTNTVNPQMGPFTNPQSRIINDGQPYITHGDNKKGFYDKGHKMICVISSDLAMFRSDFAGGVTSEEMTAFFLHEIGHNFDYTLHGIIRGWMLIFQYLVDLINDIIEGDPGRVIGDIIGMPLALILKEISPEVLVQIANIHDAIINIIPPFGDIVRVIGSVVNPVYKFVCTILYQAFWATTIPLKILHMPLNAIANFNLRKGEIYADSFATAYGYGPELVSGLAKFDKGATQTNLDLGPITGVFNDLTLLQQELICTVVQGHGSTQQRALRMSDSLNESLNKSGLSNEDKAAIRAEQKRIEKMYSDYVNMPEAKKDIVTRAYRSLIDDWYNGRPYMLFKPVDKPYAD